ncbi:post-GPI attachment to proteins factor 6 [Hippocampus zosterae]|uniref:post-GPI attachment to proteins factor 6 n=1 Tax=Hippocampus zosterae TaxID=109293 RepID=UPI00223E3430|nr:post-GPI attachment to proteins factor 6 [Hippocampus zosterae]
MALYFVLFLALAKATFGNDVEEVTFVTERLGQRLSKYEWYGNAMLQRFYIPDDTVIATWDFKVSKAYNLPCGVRNVSIHIRHGAPPVINPTDTSFPSMTLWEPPYSMLLPVASGHSSAATLNVSYPAPGEWFVASHLPENDGRIEQKGFPSCSYYIKSQLSIEREIDTPIIQSGIKLKKQTAAPNKPARLKLYVPQFSSSLSVSVDGCSTAEAAGSANCSLALSLGSNSLLRDPARVNCYGLRCSASLANPPWDTWLRVVVESIRDNQTVFFNIESNYSVGCKPKSAGLSADDGLRSNNNSPSSASNIPNLLPSACGRSIPVYSEEIEVLFLLFTPPPTTVVDVSASYPTLLTYPLPAYVTGGTLNLKLTLDTVYITPGNSSTVVACFTPLAPILQVSNSLQCHTDLFEGYGVNVSTSFPKALIRLPFPRSATWYLTLQLKCDSECGNVSTVYVYPRVFVQPCIEDCGPFGECKLLTSFTYTYGSCVCKSGWRGWGCSDESTALSSTHRIVAVLLLTLSNLSFLPVIALAVRRFYFTEASVYLFTMFFSTFYHACDQAGKDALCIMSYDTLQYCDFLGSVCSIWVTVLCMARIRKTVKYTLFLLGTLLIAMSLHLDRRGLWNLLGPVLSAIFIMVAVWVYRGVTRGQCYPPCWRRWVFYLIPGTLGALIGVSLFVFAQTEDNYFYTHSIWHILLASSVLFLLPPRDGSQADVNCMAAWRPDWTWRWTPRICGYTLCQSSKVDTT